MSGKPYWVVVVFATVTLGAGAQSSGPACSLGWNGGSTYGGGNRAAYTITAKSSREQQLANGSLVRTFSRTQGAVASDGRTMSQMAQSCVRGEDGTLLLRYNVSVNDSKARTYLTWYVNGPSGAQTEARLNHLPTMEPRPRPSPAELEAQRKAGAVQMPAHNEYKNEDLGTRSIVGVEAVGRRFTRTVPPGEEGNELPMVLTGETWTAKKLGIVLLQINEDPRIGKTTYEVEELTLGEPDASLFAPPPGYTIKETPLQPEGVVVASTTATHTRP